MADSLWRVESAKTFFGFDPPVDVINDFPNVGLGVALALPVFFYKLTRCL